MAFLEPCPTGRARAPLRHLWPYGTVARVRVGAGQVRGGTGMVPYGVGTGTGSMGLGQIKI